MRTVSTPRTSLSAALLTAGLLAATLPTISSAAEAGAFREAMRSIPDMRDAALLLHTVDYLQTLEIAKSCAGEGAAPGKYYETNPILGKFAKYLALFSSVVAPLLVTICAISAFSATVATEAGISRLV